MINRIYDWAMDRLNTGAANDIMRLNFKTAEHHMVAADALLYNHRNQEAMENMYKARVALYGALEIAKEMNWEQQYEVMHQSMEVLDLAISDVHEMIDEEV